jgi:hypothetical protein
MAEAKDQEPDGVPCVARHEALNTWGNQLLDEARTKRGKAAEGLFKAACENYQQALESKPDMPEAFVGLACARLALAGRTHDAVDRTNLLRLARGALLSAQELSAKAATYNLGCVCALGGDLEECREWLEESKEAGHLPPSVCLLADSGLAIVRDKTWFGDLLD